MSAPFSNIPPSRPGYRFAVADLDQPGIPRGTVNQAFEQIARNLTPDQLAQAGLSQSEIRRFIAMQQASGAGSASVNVETLLAQIALNMNAKNTRMQTYTYSLAAWAKVMILGENQNRDYFFVQNPGAGDILIVFESGDRSPEDFSGSTGVLTILQKRAIRVIAGGYYEPLKAPKNEISIFTLGTAAQGIVIEGQ